MPSCTILCTNQHRCSVTPSNQMPSCNIFCTNQPWCSVPPTNEMPSCIIFCTNPPCCSVTPVALSFVPISTVVLLRHPIRCRVALSFAPISTVVLLRQSMRCRVAIFCTNQLLSCYILHQLALLYYYVNQWDAELLYFAPICRCLSLCWQAGYSPGTAVLRGGGHHADLRQVWTTSIAAVIMDCHHHVYCTVK